MKQPQTITEPSKSMGTEGGEMHQGAPASGGIPRLPTTAAESAGIAHRGCFPAFWGKALPSYAAVSSPQRIENTASLSLSLSLSGVPLGGIHSQGLWLVIPLELQGKKHQPFSMAQPPGKGNTVMGAGKLRRCSLRGVGCHTLFSRTSAMKAVIFFRKISSEKLSACLFSLSRAHACSVEAS